MTTTPNCTDIRSALTPTSSLYHISAAKGKVIFIHLVETEQACQRRWEEMQWDKCNVVDDKCKIVVHGTKIVLTLHPISFSRVSQILFYF
jgi:hypothetical protein